MAVVGIVVARKLNVRRLSDDRTSSHRLNGEEGRASGEEPLWGEEVGELKELLQQQPPSLGGVGLSREGIVGEGFQPRGDPSPLPQTTFSACSWNRQM